MTSLQPHDLRSRRQTHLPRRADEPISYAHPLPPLPETDRRPPHDDSSSEDDQGALLSFVY